MKNLKQRYKESREKIAKELSIKNPMAIPRIEKVVVNMGTGDKLRDKGKKESLINEFANLTGQRPRIQPARVSVAGFGIRAGMPVGLSSTLRRDRMYAFLEKLISVVLPRLRDFRGVPAGSFDTAGNYTLGIKEHSVFPEVDLAKIDQPHGMEITIVVKNSNPESSYKLLEQMGMPFEKQDQ